MSNVTFVPYYRVERKHVILRVIFKSKVVKTITLGIKIESNQWDADKRKVVHHPNARNMNAKIQSRIHDLEGEVLKVELLGGPITVYRIKDIAEGKKFTTNFFDYVNRRIPERYTNPDTAKHAVSDLEMLRDYAPHLSFGDIDVPFLENYYKYLLSKKMGTNYAWKHLKFLRTWVNDADTAGGIILQNPFAKGSGFRMPMYREIEKEGLTIEECDRIEALQQKEVPVLLKIAAAKFLFMCYSGLRISDAKRFSVKEHLKGDAIVIDIKKNNAGTVQLQLWDRLARIIQVMESLPQKNLPESRLNAWLKTIGDMTGITRVKMSSHLGRHTFGCLCMDMELPIETIAELMKHKRLQTTRGYAKTRQTKMDEGMLKLNRLGVNP
jgi:integrase